MNFREVVEGHRINNTGFYLLSFGNTHAGPIYFTCKYYLQLIKRELVTDQEKQEKLRLENAFIGITTCGLYENTAKEFIGSYDKYLTSRRIERRHSTLIKQ